MTRQRIRHGIDHRRRGANGAQLAHPFHAQHVVLARRALVHRRDEKARHDVGMRHRVVHQTARHRLACFAVVHQRFAQRLAQPLHRTAVELTAHDHWVDHTPHIVDRRIRRQLHRAGGWVHFHLADMAAVGPGRAAGGCFGVELDATLRLTLGHLGQRHVQVGARHREAASVVLHVLRGGFQGLGGQLAGTLEGLGRPHAHRRAPGEERA